MTPTQRPSSLTPEQKQQIMDARAEKPDPIHEGMAKWEITFSDGKTCTMLSSECETAEQAFEAAVEKFGVKILCVK